MPRSEPQEPTFELSRQFSTSRVNVIGSFSAPFRAVRRLLAGSTVSAGSGVYGRRHGLLVLSLVVAETCHVVGAVVDFFDRHVPRFDCPVKNEHLLHVERAQEAALARAVGQEVLTYFLQRLETNSAGTVDDDVLLNICKYLLLNIAVE